MKKSRFSLIVLLLVLALVFVSGVAQGQGKPPDAGKPADAGKPNGTPENYRGTLVAVSESEVTLNDEKSGEQVTIAVTPATKIKIPRLKNATLADLAIDSEAMVQAVRAEDGSLTARRIHAIPAKPAKSHRVGIVIELSETSITIQNDEGETSTFTITPETRIVRKHAADELALGVKVTIIAPRDPSSGNVAAGIVIHGPEDSEGEDEGEGQGNGDRRGFRVGLIVDLSEASITIQNDEGETFTYAITTDTQIRYKNHKAELAVGFVATISTAPGDSEPPVAAAIEVHGPEDTAEEENDD